MSVFSNEKKKKKRQQRGVNPDPRPAQPTPTSSTPPPSMKPLADMDHIYTCTGKNEHAWTSVCTRVPIGDGVVGVYHVVQVGAALGRWRVRSGHGAGAVAPARQEQPQRGAEQVECRPWEAFLGPTS